MKDDDNPTRSQLDLLLDHMQAPSMPVDTSEAAANEATKDAGWQRVLVLEFIKERGDYGATDEEIRNFFRKKLKWDYNTTRPRRWELVKIERAWWSGKKRKNKSGRMARVWTAIRPDGVPEPKASYTLCPTCKGTGKLRVKKEEPDAR